MGAHCDGYLNATAGCPKCGQMAAMLTSRGNISDQRLPGDSCYRGAVKNRRRPAIVKHRGRVLALVRTLYEVPDGPARRLGLRYLGWVNRQEVR